MSEYDSIFKIIVVGDTGVGKTSILLRLCEDVFDLGYKSTIGIDFKIKNVAIEGRKIKLQIWDTAGQERFANIVNAYYRGANCAIVVFDLTDNDSLDRAGSYLKDIQKYSDTEYGKIPVVLLGNKVDLKAKREVSDENVKSFMEVNNLKHYIETSAKEDIGVKKSFELVADILYTDYIQKERQREKILESLELSKELPPKSKRFNCC